MKGVFSTYLSGIRLLFFRWKAWAIVFIANIIFAFIIARPFGALLDKVGANNEAALGGLSKFDTDFIVDVLNNFGPEINLIIGQAFFIVVLYLILNIFLSGGIIESYVYLFQRFTFGEFLSNCAKHFWRMMRLALYFIGVQILVAGVMFAIYSKLGLSPFELESEGELIFQTQIMLGIFVILMVWIDMVNEYAKVRVVLEKNRRFILPTLIDTKFFCLRHFFPILLLFLLCMLTFIAFLGIYTTLNDMFAMTSMSSLILALLIGQLYLFFRVGVRLLFTSTAIDYLRSKDWGEQHKTLSS